MAKWRPWEIKWHQFRCVWRKYLGSWNGAIKKFLLRVFGVAWRPTGPSTSFKSKYGFFRLILKFSKWQYIFPIRVNQSTQTLPDFKNFVSLTVTVKKYLFIYEIGIGEKEKLTSEEFFEKTFGLSLWNLLHDVIDCRILTFIRCSNFLSKFTNLKIKMKSKDLR